LESFYKRWKDGGNIRDTLRTHSLANVNNTLIQELHAPDLTLNFPSATPWTFPLPPPPCHTPIDKPRNVFD